MKKNSVIAACYNEILNIEEFVTRIVCVFNGLPKYDYEIILIDITRQMGRRSYWRALQRAIIALMAV